VASPSQTNTGALYAIYGIVAVSLVILTGWGGQISLGQWGIAAVGAAGAGIFSGQLHWPLPFALVAACTMGAGAAVLLGLPALRVRGLFLAVTTLAFAVVMSDVVLDDKWLGRVIPDTIARPKIIFIDTTDERALYYLCVAGLLFAVFAALGMRRSRTGRVLIAMRDNERAAQTFGVSLLRTRLATFAISGAIAALAGALFAYHQQTVESLSFDPQISLLILTMVVIGGVTSLPGAMLGTVWLGFLKYGPLEGSPTGQLLASGFGVTVLLLALPGGLAQVFYGARDALLRTVADRRGIHVPSLVADSREQRIEVAAAADADVLSTAAASVEESDSLVPEPAGTATR
jgi:branched-chain amino acid transport system permease protein